MRAEFACRNPQLRRGRRHLDAGGRESDHADYRQRTTTYYLPDGATHSVQLHAPEGSIPAAFDASALQAAIRGAAAN